MLGDRQCSKASVIFHGLQLACEVIKVYKPTLPSHDLPWPTIPWKTNICFAGIHWGWLTGKNIFTMLSGCVVHTGAREHLECISGPGKYTHTFRNTHFSPLTHNYIHIHTCAHRPMHMLLPSHMHTHKCSYTYLYVFKKKNQASYKQRRFEKIKEK